LFAAGKQSGVLDIGITLESGKIALQILFSESALHTIDRTMPIELTSAEISLAEKLSEHAKDACALVGLKCLKCEPKHFYLTVHRYYGRVQGMTAEVDRCIDWCLSKGKVVFNAQRFGNWCQKKVQWDKEGQIQKAEKEKLASGTEYQKADYERRFTR